MKGLVLASFSFLVLVGSSLVLLRLYQGKKYYRTFLLAFVISFLFYAVVYRTFSENLGFLPETLMEPNWRVDFWFGALALVLLFHIFWDVAYATALTGFSSHLMVLLSRPGGMSQEEILKIYRAHDPLDGVLAWRLDNLVRCGYLTRKESGFGLTLRGMRLALLALRLKQFYGIEEK